MKKKLTPLFHRYQKYFCLVVMSCVASLSAASQQYVYNDSTVYILLNKDWNQVLKKKDAAYVRLIHGTNVKREIYMVEDYYITGELQMRGYSSSREYLQEEGKFAWFEKGVAKPYMTGAFNNREKTGTWYKYYKNGQLKEESIAFTKTEKNNLNIDHRNQCMQVKNAWDSAGKPEVQNGSGLLIIRNEAYQVMGQVSIDNGFPNGAWVTYDSTGQKKYEDEYKEGIFIKGATYNGNDTLRYDTLQVPPSFPGGEEALSRFLNKHIVYPLDAQRQGISGTVVLNFIVKEDGQVSDITVNTSVYSSIDNEAKRVVRKMPKWTPGKQRGKQVKVAFNMPVKFSLQQ